MRPALIAAVMKARNVAPSAVTAAPNAPTIGTAVAGDTEADVAFTPAGSGAPATSYTATSSPGSLTATGASSPLTVTGLTNGVAYTFTVHATNAGGNSAESSASNSVTPVATDPYDWAAAPTGYLAGRDLMAAFDLNTVDFHATDPIAKPYPAVVSNSPVSCGSAAAANAALNGNNRHVQLTGTWAGDVFVDYDDVIVELMAGSVITGNLRLSIVNRVTIIGTGRLIGNCLIGNFSAAPSFDVVWDGPELAGEFAAGEGSLVTRAAKLRGRQRGDISYAFNDLVVADTNIYSGTGWAMRFSSTLYRIRRIAIFQTQAKNITNATVRFHGATAPLGEPGPFWVGSSDVGNTVEGFVLRGDSFTAPNDVPIGKMTVTDSLLWGATGGIEASPSPGWCRDFEMNNCTVSNTNGTYTPPVPTTPETFTASSSSGLLLTHASDWPDLSVFRASTTTALPTGLSAATDYWVLRVSATTSRVATSLANALAATAIAYTDAGTGTHTMTNPETFTGTTVQDSDSVAFPAWNSRNSSGDPEAL